MSHSSSSVAESRLTAALDEAEATLDWAESGRRPAVLRMARLRPVLAAAGISSMAVEALGLFAAGVPAVPETLNAICREAAMLLDDAIGPELAARWAIDAVAEQLSPEAVASEIGTERISVAMTEQAMARVWLLISRSIEVLSEIAEDESVLPDLREAAADALDMLDDLDLPQSN
jgi:hypothetical protein